MVKRVTSELLMSAKSGVLNAVGEWWMFWFFEVELSNDLIKSFVWHICHEGIFSVTPRTGWPSRYLGQD